MEDQNNALIALAERILSELELLTSTIKATALVKFQSDLGTDPRRSIYQAIDGEKDSQALADSVGCSLRTVQLLIKELQEKDLIDVSKRSNSFIPCKSISKIATYYARLDIINAGGGVNG